MNIQERITQPTPKFFKKLRNIGIALATASGAILTAPIALPSAVISITGFSSYRNGSHYGQSSCG